VQVVRAQARQEQHCTIAQARSGQHPQQPQHAVEQRQVQPVSGVSWLDADIPYASSVERMGLYRQPLSGFTAAADPANAAYTALWLAVQQQLSRLRTA